MKERDEFDKQAEVLLPCEWLTDHGVTENCEYADKGDVCHTCTCRPAVAAALRLQAKKRDAYVKESFNILAESEQEIADAEAVLKKTQTMLQTSLSDREALRAEVKRLKESTSVVLIERLRNQYDEQCQQNHDLRDEVERLTHELLVIGDMAVVDFDDAVVGKVDAAVKPYATYAEKRRAELAQYDAMKTKIDQLAIWLKEERAMGDKC